MSELRNPYKTYENKQQNERLKPKHIDNHIQGKWSEHSIERAETVRLDKQVR